MKTYSIIYFDARGTLTRWDGQGIDAPDAFQRMREELNLQPGTISVQHQIEHRVPRITLEVDGAIMASYADSEVDLLIVNGHNDAVYDAARAEEGQFMPSGRRAENLAHVLDDAFLWHKREVDQNLTMINFDFEFIADPDRVKEFTDKVFKDAADWK